MKKIFNIVVIFLISFFVISSFGSCKKAKEKKIVGNWKLVSEKKPIQGETVTYFVFLDDNTVKRITEDTLIADYFLLSEDLQYYLQINGFDTAYVDLGGKYRINELSKDNLQITRIEKSEGHAGGAFKRLEFIKE